MSPLQALSEAAGTQPGPPDPWTSPLQAVREAVGTQPGLPDPWTSPLQPSVRPWALTKAVLSPEVTPPGSQ